MIFFFNLVFCCVYVLIDKISISSLSCYHLFTTIKLLFLLLLTILLRKTRFDSKWCCIIVNNESMRRRTDVSTSGLVEVQQLNFWLCNWYVVVFRSVYKLHKGKFQIFDLEKVNLDYSIVLHITLASNYDLILIELHLLLWILCLE